MKYIPFYFLFLITVSLICCKKTTVEPLDIAVFDLTNSCEDSVVYPNSTFMPQYIYASDYKQWLQVNPSNPNEFLYYIHYFNDRKLFFLNRLTMQSHLIIDKDISRPPKWGRNGYILFDDGSYIYTVKPTGDSLEIRAKGINGEWNFTGDKFLYYTKDSITQADIYIVQDFVTGKKDSVPLLLLTGWSWQNEDNLYLQTSRSAAPTGFKIINMDNFSSLTIPFPSDIASNNIHSVTWISKNEILYALNKSLYILNVSTRKNLKLVKFCQNNTPSLTYSYATNEVFVLLSKYENIQDSDAILISTPKILVFDLNTFKMSVLDF